MIICHRHRFIFIKTRKTASTSLEIGLSKFCGPEDTITPIAPLDEEIRKNLGYPGPQNYQFNPILVSSKHEPPIQLNAFYNHMPVLLAKRCLPPQIWKTYFTFSIERNPWDKGISLYYWRTRNTEPRPPLEAYLKTESKYDLSNFYIYGINNHIGVDFIMRYENLIQELKDLEQRLQLPSAIELPQSKSQYRLDRRPYQEIYTPESRLRISNICAREISLLNYTY